MKKKNWILFYPFILLGAFLMFTDSCKKTEDIIPKIDVPALTTSAVTAITLTTATCGANITSGGGSAITIKGVCWSISPSFTIDNCLNKTTDGAGDGSFTSYLTGLNGNTTYYVRAYATNNTGTGYGNLMNFTSVTTTFGIGFRYQGGIIAYILQTGDPGFIVGETHGLIAAPSDQSTNILWGAYTQTNVTATGLGTGNANTNSIVSKLGVGSYSVKLCYDLELGGYSDWYLPSRDELEKLCINKVMIGGFTNNIYWSSSEDAGNAVNAWIYDFNYGTPYNNNKNLINYVRAIRSF